MTLTPEQLESILSKVLDQKIAPLATKEQVAELSGDVAEIETKLGIK
jgi:hypothetical protein